MVTKILSHYPEKWGFLPNWIFTRHDWLLIVNSCLLKTRYKKDFLDIIKIKNPQSELFFAKQERNDSGFLVNYVDNVGEFGFSTSQSERELFIHRKEGLIKALRLAYERIF